MKKRVKYNWLFAIDDLKLTDEFSVYKADMNLKRHLKNKKELSVKRLARSFVSHIAGVWNMPGLRNEPSWIVGQEKSIFGE